MSQNGERGKWTVAGGKATHPHPLFRVPSNVRFEVDDVESEWTYHKPFDFIHARFLGGAIRDWPRLVRQCYEYVLNSHWRRYHKLSDIGTGTPNRAAIPNWSIWICTGNPPIIRSGTNTPAESSIFSLSRLFDRGARNRVRGLCSKVCLKMLASRTFTYSDMSYRWGHGRPTHTW